MDFIKLSQLFWQAANFLIFYFVISRYVVPPISKMLEKRRKEIEEGLTFAQKAKKELEESEQTREQVLKKARVEAQVIVEEAKKKADVLIADAKVQAKIEADKEITTLMQRAESDIAKKYEQIDLEVVELAMAVVEKSLKNALEGTSSHDLVKKELSSLSKVKEYIK